MAVLSFADQATFVADADLLVAVGQAMLTVAQTVRVEGGTAPDHALRADLALRVWQEPDLWALSFLKGVATVDGMTLSPDDADLVAAVATVWDEPAGSAGPAV